MTERYYPGLPPYDPIAQQSEGSYEDYKKIKGFEDVGYFLQAYIVSGGVVTINVTRNDMIDATTIVAVLNNDVLAREGASFQALIANGTYYFDLTKDGDFNWAAVHPPGAAGTDYLTIATVTTDANKNIDVITDTRGDIGGFRMKPGYGATPIDHASSHVTGGTDVIPDAIAGGASGLMSGEDKDALDQVVSGLAAQETEFTAHETSTSAHGNVFANYANRDNGVVNLFVNGAIGNDANDGSANDAAHALKTIQAAIDKRKNIQVAAFNIFAAAGDYSNENLVVHGQVGDNLVIRGAATVADAGSYKINSINFRLCRYCTLIGFEILGNALAAFQPIIGIANVSYMEVQECLSITNLTAVPNDGIKLTHGAIAYLKNCTISNKNVGISVASGSQAISNNCTGTGNTYGMLAQEGHIYKNGTAPGGTTPELIAFGGVIA